MMKKNFLIIALLAISTVMFTACPTKEDPITEKTNFLTSGKWILSTATSAPAYLLSDGGEITDLTQGYLSSNEMNDVLKFDKNGGIILTPGDPNGKEHTIGVWKFTDTEGNELDMQIPFFDDLDPEHVKVNVLDKSTFKIRYDFTEDDDNSKTKRNYSFSLTYIHK